MQTNSVSRSLRRGALVAGLTLTTLLANVPAAFAQSSIGPPAASMGSFAGLARSLKPCVVNIVVEKPVAEKFNPLAGLFDDEGNRKPRFDAVETGEGSGVVISSDGYIATNNHVVSNARSVLVTLSDGRELKAKVIGTDAKTDLALVKVDATGLPFAQLGNSDKLEVGDWVMAIGNPFGLSATVTVGVLSGKGRVIGEGPYDDFLQTDASINPGNSGGPLFDTKGQVVGINTAIIRGGQGIGFAIPVNVARQVVQQLKTTGYVTRGFLGLGVQALDSKLKLALQLPDATRGALVSEVLPKGPSGNAGIHVEDVVTAINGHPVMSDRDLRSQAAQLPVGKVAQLTVLHSGKQEMVPVTIAQQPDELAKHDHAPAAASKEKREAQALGIELAPLSPEIAAELKTHNLQGVVIAEVATNSAADRAGLEPGDIIRTINNRKFSNVTEFIRMVKAYEHGPGLAFLVERHGQTSFVSIDT
jgi:serine protease Do